VDKWLQIPRSDVFWFERVKSSLKGGMITSVISMLNKLQSQMPKSKAWQRRVVRLMSHWNPAITSGEPRLAPKHCSGRVSAKSSSHQGTQTQLFVVKEFKFYWMLESQFAKDFSVTMPRLKCRPSCTGASVNDLWSRSRLRWMQTAWWMGKFQGDSPPKRV